MNRLRLVRRGQLTTCGVAFAVALSTANATAQQLSLRLVDGLISVRAPRLGLIEGRTRARLQDGRSIPVVFELALMAAASGPVLAQARERFHLSYDLWEERFAVSREGTPTRSTSHLTAAAAEEWCLRQLAVPRAALGAPGRPSQLWVRLSYRVEGPAPSDADGDGTFSLRSLVELLSRGERGAADSDRTFEAGPLQLPD